jgi:hypothetical protein
MAAGVASSVFNVTIRSDPFAPPATVPIARPPTLTVPDDTATVPSVRIAS